MCTDPRWPRLPISGPWSVTIREQPTPQRGQSGASVGYRRVYSGLPGGGFGGVLLVIDPLGQVFVRLHQLLQVAVRRAQHAEVGKRVPDLGSPQADVADAWHDPGK